MRLVLLCFLRSKKQRQCKNAVFFALQKTKMLCKNAFLHHILLVLNIFLWKMWCWTFSFGKCTQKCIFASNAFLHSVAEHFTKSNVRQNAFWHQMHFGIKCIFASNAFDAALTFCWCWTFSKGKCSASNAFLQTKMLESGKMHFGVHFPKENVQHHIFQRKMFSTNKMWCKNVFVTFSFGKCSATPLYFYFHFL